MQFKYRRSQHTVRGVPHSVDRALRERANAEGKSLNQVLVEALTKASGTLGPAEPPLRDLDALAGRWQEDPAFDEALRAQDQVDESLWR